MSTRRLLVYPDSDRVEQALVEASRAGQLVDARFACTFAQLVDRCEPARFVRRAPASPFFVQSLLTRVAPVLAREAFGDFAAAPDFARAASEVISHLKSQNVTVDLLRDTAGRAEGTVRSRGLAIASLWEAVDSSLEHHALLDRADVLTVATQRLLTQGLPPRLMGFEEIEIAFVHDLFAARLSFLDALAKACRKQHVRFVLTWPGVGRDEVDIFVAQAIRHIEQRWELDPHDLQLHRANTPLEWVAEQVFAQEPRRSPAPELDAFSAASARDEAREMARRIKRLVNAGTPPERVAVVFRDLASDTEAVLEAFEEVDLPARARLGVPLTSSGVGRLAFSLLSLVDDAFPVADVVAWLTSRYARAPVACKADAARWLAEAGVRDNAVGRSATQGAYSIRLDALEQRFVSQIEVTSYEVRRESLNTSLAALREVSASARALIRLVSAIPERARYRVLLDAWWQAVQGIGLFAALEANEPRDTTSFLSREVDRALARDQAAADALRELRERLVEALDQSGLAQVDVDRGVFTSWLMAMAADLNLAARGVRTAAVWLLDARELAGRRFEYVFLGGMVDGRFPGRAPPLPLLGEDQRKSLNAIAKAPLFRLGVAEGDFGLPLRIAEDRLLFHHVLSAATEHVTLSRARFDSSGRAALASPFFDALGRAVEGFEVDDVPRVSVPGLDEVMNERDLRVRAALEVAGPAETRQTARDGRRDALASAFEREPWLVAAAARGAAERERLLYFSSDDATPGAFSGLVNGRDVQPEVMQRLTYGADHPVSANELREWANCGFQGLSKRMLNLRKSNATGEDIDAMGRGTFLHEVLRELIPVLSARGLLGRELTGDELEPLLAQAVKTAGEAIERQRGTGHPVLWAIAKSRAAKVVREYIGSEVLLPIDGARPVLVETEFGRPKSPEHLRQVAISAAFEGESDVYVTGTIDRLDVGEQVAGVVDYKSGRMETARQRADALFEPDFQLPLYALAIRQAYPEHTVDAAWVGLKLRESTTLLETLNTVGVKVNDLLSMSAEVRASMQELGLANLANAVHGLLARRRSGDFGAKPIDCGFCEMQSVCRISARRLAGER